MISSRYLFLILAVALLPVAACGTGGGETEPHGHEETYETHNHVMEETADHQDHEHDTDVDHDNEDLDTHEGHDHGDDSHAHGEESTGTDVNSEGWEGLVGLETVEAVIQPLDVALSVPGAIVPDPDNHAVISPFIESNVNAVFGVIGDRVKHGSVLACLTSPEIGMMRAEYERAEAELAIKEKFYTRRQILFEEDVIPRRALEEAELDLNTARVGYDFALNRLNAVGVPTGDISGESVCPNCMDGSSIHLVAPIDGVIVGRNASVGQKVGSDTAVFEIIDLSTVWVEANVFEKDLSKIAVGRPVYLQVAAYDDTFTGTVTYVGHTVDEDTKTIKIIAEIDNRSEKLKPGMFATVDIVIGRQNNVLAIPREAILEDEDLAIVFVREGDDYHRHIVETGIESSGLVEITDGLNTGDTVVTTGNYQLKSRLRMSTIDPHAGHNH